MADGGVDDGSPHEAPGQEERLRVLALMNSEIDQRHDREDAAHSTVEGKLTAIIGFLLVAIPLVLKYQSGWLAIIAVIAFGLSIVFALVSLWPREFVGVPKPQRLIEIYTDTHLEASLEERMLAAVVATKNSAYEENARRSRRKLLFARLCHQLLAVGFVLMVAAVLISDLDGGSDDRRPSGNTTTTAVTTSTGGSSTTTQPETTTSSGP